jgi:hypothetical protein
MVSSKVSSLQEARNLDDKTDKEVKENMKPKKLSYYKKRAWDAFSLWVRKSNEVDGLVECYTCGKRKPYKEMNAGHGIGGRNNAILFDERIVKPQCAGCNIWGRGQYQVFTRKLINELGLEVYDEIVKHSSDTIKYKASDFLDIEFKYNKLLEDL